MFCQTHHTFTQFVDGRNYNKKTGVGILLATIPGIHAESVPSGPDVLQVVLYKTDDEVLGIGMGPEHWILVANQKETYEPDVYPVMEDHGLEVNNPPPPNQEDNPPETTELILSKEATKKANEEKQKKALAQLRLESIAERLRNKEDKTDETPEKDVTPKPRPTKFQRANPRATSRFGNEDTTSGDAVNFMGEKPPQENPLTFLADEVASACKWPVHSTTYADTQLKFKLAQEMVNHNLEITNRAHTDLGFDKNGKRRRGNPFNEIAHLEAEMMIVKNVYKIAWVPNAKGRKRPSATAKYLRGHFRVKVKMDGVRKGGTTTTNASIEWVEKHFKHSALGVAQRISYEVREELEFADKKIPTSKKYGYVKVEAEGVTCSAVDPRVINRLKYIAAKTIQTGPLYTKNKKGKHVSELEKKNSWRQSG